jgi:hypothetical protein
MDYTPTLSVLRNLINQPLQWVPAGKDKNGDLQINKGKTEMLFRMQMGNPVLVALWPIDFTRWGVNPVLGLEDHEKRVLLQILKDFDRLS